MVKLVDLLSVVVAYPFQIYLFYMIATCHGAIDLSEVYECGIT